MSDTPYAQPHTPNQFDIRCVRRLVPIHFRCRISQGNPIRTACAQRTVVYWMKQRRHDGMSRHLSCFFLISLGSHQSKPKNPFGAHARKIEARALPSKRKIRTRKSQQTQTNESDGYEMASIMSVNATAANCFGFPPLIPPNRFAFVDDCTRLALNKRGDEWHNGMPLMHPKHTPQW